MTLKIREKICKFTPSFNGMWGVAELWTLCYSSCMWGFFKTFLK